MGYSTTVTMKSQRAKAEMLAFLEEHYRTATEVSPELARGFRDPSQNMEDNEGLKIGIYKDGGGNDYLCLYAYCSICWIALRAGKRRLYTKRLGAREAVPYWVHDHFEGYPVLVRSQWEGRVNLEELRDVTVVDDEDGFMTIEHYFWGCYRLEPLMKDWPRINEVVQAELKRLTALWEARNG